MNSSLSFRFGALSVLVVILGAGALLWPLPVLGFVPDLSTGILTLVEPGTAAGRAGLKAGDRITAIYGYPWSAINTRFLLLPLPWRRGMPTPITVRRGTVDRSLVLDAGTPSLSFQLEKLVRSLIALICWGTGYLLGTSPRASDRGLRRSGWFWVVLGGTLALYPLAQLVSYLLAIAVLWVQCGVLAPTAVAIHRWYPQRQTRPEAQRLTWRLLLAAVCAAQVLLVSLALTSPAAVVLYERLVATAPFVFLLSIGLSLLLLWQAYRVTTVGHIRRQIRLIWSACALAATWWVLLLLLRWGSPRLQQFVLPAALPVGATLIPLAYLAGGVRADLMQLDQTVRRVLLHALTVLCLLMLLVSGGQSGLLVVTPSLGMIVILGFYGPLYQALQRLLTSHTQERQREQALRDAARQLGTSLDSAYLLDTLRDGLLAAFMQPPLAIYHCEGSSSETLALRVAHHMVVPGAVNPALVSSWRERGALVLTATQLQFATSQRVLDPDEAALVFHASVVVWGLIRNQDGELLGLVLLGPRGDDEPYHGRDLRELEQLLGTAALALTNSASYAAQVEARRELRELRIHAEQVEEQTAADIASDIHDQVLSMQMRLNREHLLALHADLVDPELQERLDDVIFGEESMGETLRLICDQLKSTAHRLPLSLLGSLRQKAKWIAGSWDVVVDVQAEHEPVPLTEAINRALTKIATEALSNAVAHGKPTRIIVQVCFPTNSTQPLLLTVTNDGPHPPQPIVAKSGHWGVRNMREYAEAIGGTTRWTYPEEGGTCVVVTLPPAVVAHAMQEATTLVGNTEFDTISGGEPGKESSPAGGEGALRIGSGETK
jgi:signal transduction histidine kinase